MAHNWRIYFDNVPQTEFPEVLMIGVAPHRMDHFPPFEDFSRDVRHFMQIVSEMGPLFIPEDTNVGTLLASYLAVNNFQVFNRLPDTVTAAYPAYLLVVQNVWLTYSRLKRPPCVINFRRRHLVSLI